MHSHRCRKLVELHEAPRPRDVQRHGEIATRVRGLRYRDVTMNPGRSSDDVVSAIRQYSAAVRARLGTDEAGPVSYAGLWLLLASLAPVVVEAEEFRHTLGLSVTDAGDEVAGLLDRPHPAVAAALGAWLARDVTLAGDLPVTLEELPSQDALDAWASDQTAGLIATFPLQLKPETMLVLASALVLTPRWSGGVSYDGDEDDTLLVTDGFQAVVGTAMGPVAVTTPATDDNVDVISVIAAPGVPPAKVWDAVDEVVAGLDAGEVPNNSFPDGMAASEVERGHAWASFETTRSYWGEAPEDGSTVWEARVPMWSATTTHDLTGAPGVALVAEPIQALLPEDSDVRCIQGATATYDDEGFSAAAVTAVDFMATGVPQQHLRTVRQVSLAFDRPHAVIAVARGGAWDGIPLFHAWVTPPRRPNDDN